MKIAILGAESTGKSSLARALVASLAARGLRVALAGEYLREWCEREGRTPRADEQAAIAREQMRRAEAAWRDTGAVVADTTALMTAIYSDYLFQDRSLYEPALRDLAHYDHVLVTGLDLPWVADGLQRDGAHVREPVDALLRAALADSRIAYRTIYGTGETRLGHALSGLPVARDAWLSAREARAGWVCDKCSDPDCERRLFSRLLPAAGGRSLDR